MRNRLLAVATFCVLSMALSLIAQTTRPTDQHRLADVAKRFGTTPAGLEQLVKSQLGEPVVVDGDLIVGLHRDASGHVNGVQITSGATAVTLNRTPSKEKPALQYSRWDVTDAPNQLCCATDLDGDGRIDQMIVPTPGQSPPTILLRIGTAFLPATAVGGGQFKRPDYRLVSFDSAHHEWTEKNASSATQLAD